MDEGTGERGIVPGEFTLVATLMKRLNLTPSSTSRNQVCRDTYPSIHREVYKVFIRHEDNLGFHQLGDSEMNTSQHSREDIYPVNKLTDKCPPRCQRQGLKKKKAKQVMSGSGGGRWFM